MKKFLSLSLVLVLVVSLLAIPAFAAKPENPGNSNNNGNSNKTENVEKNNGKSEKVDQVKKYLIQWQNRYENYDDEEKIVIDDEDIDTAEDSDSDVIVDDNDKLFLPWGLQKRDGELPPGLAKKEILPYGLLKRIDPDAIPKGQVEDEITGEDIDIETLLVDSVELLESAVEGDGLGEYFDGSIEAYDLALTTYTELVEADDTTEEEIAVATETLHDAYNTFIMSRTATLDELVDYNTFLEEVSEIIDTVEVGTEEDDDITPQNYNALVAYFDTLTAFEVDTDEENDVEPDKVSIEAMLTLFENATTQFDTFMGYEEPIEDGE